MHKTFKKKERLFKRNLIKELFAKKSSYFYLYPFKMVYQFLPAQDSDHQGVQVLFTVPKRNFKRAVDRNHIKRLFREAYRNNKHLLSNKNNLVIGYIYTSSKIEEYIFLEKKLKQSLERLSNEVNQAIENESKI